MTYDGVKICVILMACVIILIIFWIRKQIFLISVVEKNVELNKLNWIEKKYGKKYPLGNDKFQIIHYPLYNSFFEQFNDYLYLVKKDESNIVATCCFANICDNIYYICDLKKIIKTSNVSLSFVVYFYYLNLCCINMTLFGIVMEPNSNINYISNKFGFKKIKIFNLYKVKFYVVKKNYNLFNKIFADFFIVPGYKKFVLESNNNVMNCYHIAEPIDNQIVKVQEQIPLNDIDDNTDIMFCLDVNNKFNLELEQVYVKSINLMNVISNKQIDSNKFNLDKIKTYMI